jgi:tetratricopeptide (TPR) repeat protein
MKAEEYHHRGLPFEEAIAYHEGETGGGEEDEHHEPRGIALKKDLFSRLYCSVKVTADSHLKPSEEKEALPWFYVEVMFNPHDIRGYVLGAYWLQRVGRLHESLKFLKSGEVRNPRSADIIGSIGMVYYKLGDLDSAAGCLDKSAGLWLEGKAPNMITDKYARTDRYFEIAILGNIYEKMGDTKKAIDVFEKLYKLEPDVVLMNKIRKLQGAK